MPREHSSSTRLSRHRRKSLVNSLLVLVLLGAVACNLLVMLGQSQAAIPATSRVPHQPEDRSSTLRYRTSTTASNRNNNILCKTNRKIPVLDQIQVANDTTSFPKVLCFIMTHSKASSKMKTIKKTWGQRCDKLLFASNHTDNNIGAVAMESDASYLGLWKKLNETLLYIYEHYRDQYDWIFKADDDTYVLVENLKEYLSSPEVTKHNHKPLVYGRRFSSPQYVALAKREAYFGNPRNAEFGERFYKKIRSGLPLIYNYGGSGYAMNLPFVSKYLEVMKGPDTIHGNPPEDQALSVVMAYHDTFPADTRDNKGRERFHPEGPYLMYNMKKVNEKLYNLFNDNHQATGGLLSGEECCASKSISFHHVTPRDMALLDRKLYKCRGRE